MSRRKQIVWVVMHYEYIGMPDAVQYEIDVRRKFARASMFGAAIRIEDVTAAGGANRGSTSRVM